MILTRCVLTWSVCVVVLLCRPAWSDVKVIQPYRVVSRNGTAQVQCSIQTPSSKDGGQQYLDSEPEDLRVTLLKGLHGSQLLCSSMLTKTEQGETQVKEQEEQAQCSTKMAEDAVELTVSGLTAADTDIYRCEIEVFFPPPYLKLTGNGTLIHVLESSDCPAVAGRQTSHRPDEDMDDEEEARTSTVSVPMVVLIILIMFAILFIMYLQVLQWAQGRREMVQRVPTVYSC